MVDIYTCTRASCYSVERTSAVIPERLRSHRHPAVKSEMSLQGHVALVTGGARGIGLHTVKELLREGANVAVCDVSAAGEDVVKELQAEHGAQRSLFVQADVRDDAQLEAAFTKTKSTFGKLNIVVNNAGVVKEHDWNLEVDINLKGVIRGTMLAWKHMGKHEGGSGGAVVNIASFAALLANSIFPVYSGTKYAVIGFSRGCGEPYNLDRTGVRVMVVCPGQTETPIFNEITFLAPNYEKEFQKMTTSTPIQKVENVAKAIVHVIQNGPSGSVWVSENEQPPYQLDFPAYTDMRLKQ